MQYLLYLFCLIFSISAFANWKQENSSWLARRAIVVKMADTYQEAVALAKEIAAKTTLEMQERRLSWDEKRNMLTLSDDDCKARGLGTYPCYQARGIDEWLSYISIEEASAYQNLPNGKFAVMASISLGSDLGSSLGPNKEYDLLLDNIRQIYPKTMDLEVKVFTGVVGQSLYTF